jgi:hypothetical protein
MPNTDRLAWSGDNPWWSFHWNAREADVGSQSADTIKFGFSS